MRETSLKEPESCYIRYIQVLVQSIVLGMGNETPKILGSTYMYATNELNKAIGRRIEVFKCRRDKPFTQHLVH